MLKGHTTAFTLQDFPPQIRYQVLCIQTFYGIFGLYLISFLHFILSFILFYLILWIRITQRRFIWSLSFTEVGLYLYHVSLWYLCVQGHNSDKVASEERVLFYPVSPKIILLLGQTLLRHYMFNCFLSLSAKSAKG